MVETGPRQAVPKLASLLRESETLAWEKLRRIDLSFEALDLLRALLSELRDNLRFNRVCLGWLQFQQPAVEEATTEARRQEWQGTEAELSEGAVDLAIQVHGNSEGLPLGEGLELQRQLYFCLSRMPAHLLCRRHDWIVARIKEWVGIPQLADFGVWLWRHIITETSGEANLSLLEYVLEPDVRVEGAVRGRGGTPVALPKNIASFDQLAYDLTGDLSTVGPAPCVYLLEQDPEGLLVMTLAKLERVTQLHAQLSPRHSSPNDKSHYWRQSIEDSSQTQRRHTEYLEFLLVLARDALRALGGSDPGKWEERVSELAQGEWYCQVRLAMNALAEPTPTPQLVAARKQLIRDWTLPWARRYRAAERPLELYHELWYLLNRAAADLVDDDPQGEDELLHTVLEELENAAVKDRRQQERHDEELLAQVPSVDPPEDLTAFSRLALFKNAKERQESDDYDLIVQNTMYRWLCALAGEGELPPESVLQRPSMQVWREQYENSEYRGRLSCDEAGFNWYVSTWSPHEPIAVRSTEGLMRLHDGEGVNELVQRLCEQPPRPLRDGKYRDPFKERSHENPLRECVGKRPDIAHSILKHPEAACLHPKYLTAIGYGLSSAAEAIDPADPQSVEDLKTIADAIGAAVGLGLALRMKETAPSDTDASAEQGQDEEGRSELLHGTGMALVRLAQRMMHYAPAEEWLAAASSLLPALSELIGCRTDREPDYTGWPEDCARKAQEDRRMGLLHQRFWDATNCDEGHAAEALALITAKLAAVENEAKSQSESELADARQLLGESSRPLAEHLTQTGVDPKAIHLAAIWGSQFRNLASVAHRSKQVDAALRQMLVRFAMEPIDELANVREYFCAGLLGWSFPLHAFAAELRPLYTAWVADAAAYIDDRDYVEHLAAHLCYLWVQRYTYRKEGLIADALIDQALALVPPALKTASHAAWLRRLLLRQFGSRDERFSVDDWRRHVLPILERIDISSSQRVEVVEAICLVHTYPGEAALADPQIGLYKWLGGAIHRLADAEEYPHSLLIELLTELARRLDPDAGLAADVRQADALAIVMILKTLAEQHDQLRAHNQWLLDPALVRKHVKRLSDSAQAVWPAVSDTDAVHGFSRIHRDVLGWIDQFESL